MDQSKSKTKAIGRGLVIWLVCMTLYVAYVLFHLDYSLGFVNVMIAGIAFAVFIYAVFDVSKNGLRVYTSFLVTYFIFLFFNNLNLSAMQVEKNLVDIYYFIFLPLVFTLPFASLDKRVDFRRGGESRRLESGISFLDLVTIVLIVLYLYIRFTSIEKTGLRFLSPGFDAEVASEIGASGEGTGLSTCLMWTIIMLIPSVRNKYIKLFSMAIILFTCIFLLKRGSMIKVLFFFVCYALVEIGPIRLSRKTFLIFLVIVLVGGYFFALWGDNRQKARGASSDYSVSSVMRSRVDNDTISWIYAYTALNYDVLKQFAIDGEPTGEFKELLKPVNRLIYGNQIYEETDFDFSQSLNGFNSATFLTPFVKELGPYSMLSIVLLGFIIRLLIYFSATCNARGVYAMLVSNAGLAFFGNSFSTPTVAYAIVAALAVCCVESLLASPARSSHSNCMKVLKGR